MIPVPTTETARRVVNIRAAAYAAIDYVAARDAVEAADGPTLMESVWRLDSAWHALRVAVGAPCESTDCGCVAVVTDTETTQ